MFPDGDKENNRRPVSRKRRRQHEGIYIYFVIKAIFSQPPDLKFFSRGIANKQDKAQCSISEERQRGASGRDICVKEMLSQ